MYNSEFWSNTTHDLQPLDNLQRERIEINTQVLSQLIEFSGGLIGELYAKNRITQTERIRIENPPHQPLDSARKLLEIMSRKSMAAFNDFVECLKTTGQLGVVFLLQHDAGKRLFILLHCSHIAPNSALLIN